MASSSGVQQRFTVTSGTSSIHLSSSGVEGPRPGAGLSWAAATEQATEQMIRANRQRAKALRIKFNPRLRISGASVYHNGAAASEGNRDMDLAGSYRIFFPRADSVNSTARLAVRLCSSITGLTSTISKLVMRP